jgi:branched-subunit amino acid aminotransferase/4-amino-4-deoxychorismate lyase
MHVYIEDVGKHTGDEVTLKGWLHNRRSSGKIHFLIVRDGTVLSPPQSAVLDGISLRVTEELCRDLGIPFAERPLTVADCRAADEAMLTGTAFCLAGVSHFDGTALRWPGPVTEALVVAWTRLVGLDFRAQILGVR